MSRRALTANALAAVLAAGTLASCGGGDAARTTAPKGSPENPIQAIAPSAGEVTGESATKPGTNDIVEAQQRASAPAKDRGNPCAWVTKAQAQSIVGGRLLDPVVAPQGPTCIYRNRSGTTFATMAIQPVSFKQLRRQMRRIERVNVAEQTAYCGMHGQPMLYVPLAKDRVLSVAAPCETAVRFARRAVSELVP